MAKTLYSLQDLNKNLYKYETVTNGTQEWVIGYTNTKHHIVTYEKTADGYISRLSRKLRPDNTIEIDKNIFKVHILTYEESKSNWSIPYLEYLKIMAQR